MADSNEIFYITDGLAHLNKFGLCVEARIYRTLVHGDANSAPRLKRLLA